MYAANAQPSYSQSDLPFAPGFGVPDARLEGRGLSEPGCTIHHSAVAPRLIRSVVEEAGLGRFVYLQGKSGKRYVFSSISNEQVSLYDNALFASAEPGSEVVHIAQKPDNISRTGRLLYVHLLSDEETEADMTLRDLD